MCPMLSAFSPGVRAAQPREGGSAVVWKNARSAFFHTTAEPGASTTGASK